MEIISNDQNVVSTNVVSTNVVSTNVVSTNVVSTNMREVDLGHKKVNIRKWKVKDRNDFKKSLKKIAEAAQNTEKLKSTENPQDLYTSIESSDASDQFKDLINSLVINCVIEKDIDLSPEEIEYLFIKMREYSISDEFTLEYTCPDCLVNNKQVLKIEDVISFSFSEYNDIVSSNNTLTMGPVLNNKFYNEKLMNSNDDDDFEYIDLCLHVHSFNGDNNKTLDELLDIIYDLDTDVLDDIMEQYNTMKFKINREKAINCQNDDCKRITNFEFDEIPGFFPSTWGI